MSRCIDWMAYLIVALFFSIAFCPARIEAQGSCPQDYTAVRSGLLADSSVPGDKYSRPPDVSGPLPADERPLWLPDPKPLQTPQALPAGIVPASKPPASTASGKPVSTSSQSAPGKPAPPRRPSSQPQKPPPVAPVSRTHAPQGRPVVICFQQGNDYAEYQVREISATQDRAFWNQRTPGGQTESADWLKYENDYYYSGRLLGLSDIFKKADNGAIVNEYCIGPNLPTYRQNCGGLAFARLLVDPYEFPTNAAAEFCRLFSSNKQQPLSPQKDDVILYFADPSKKTPEHFAIFNTNEAVFSKDHQETVRYGSYDDMPRCKPDYKYWHIYRFDWNNIRTYRKGEVVVTVEAEDHSGKIAGALVELIPREPIGSPPRHVWANEKTDESGKAAFLGFDKSTGKAFPFERKKYNLTVQVSCRGYETKKVEINDGPRFPENGPYTVTICLKPQTGWIRQGPFLQIHQNELPIDRRNPYIHWSSAGSSLTVKDVSSWHYDPSLDRNNKDFFPTSTTCTCELPPSLAPGQKFKIKIDCQNSPVQSPTEWFTPPVTLHLPWDDFNTAVFHVDAEYGQDYDINKLLSIDLKSIKELPDGKTHLEGNWVFGQNAGLELHPHGRPTYKYKAPDGTRPPNITIVMSPHNGSPGIYDDWASLTWRYTLPSQEPVSTPPGQQPETLAKASTSASSMPSLAPSYKSQPLEWGSKRQPQAPAGFNAPSEPPRIKTGSKSAPEYQPAKPGAINLAGTWSVTNTSKFRTDTSTMTLTQAGNEITFHFPQEGPGCFMRGNLHGDSVDVEIANNNVVHTRGTLTYNHNTHELQGFLVYPGGDKIECRFRR